MILTEWTIADLQEKMGTGELDARQIAELCLLRIEEMDKQGPFINSVMELNPYALTAAERLDKNARQGRFTGNCMAFPF